MSGPNPQAPPTHQNKGHLLTTHPKGLATALGVVALLLLGASILTGVTGSLPTAAFGWTFGLQVIRAGVIFAIVAVLAIVLIRGWTGEWPSSFSTTGLGYNEAADATQAAVDYGEAQAIVNFLRPIVDAANKQEGAD